MTASHRLPGARALAGYRRSWLPRDIVAGLVLVTLLVPQGMAYAELAGLPAITGLYASVTCLLAYALFGPSRILVLGPDSALASMIAATIVAIIGSNGSPERAIALASMLALMVGAIMLIAAFAKLGFVADLLSKPTQIGYMNGLALIILVGQLPRLFGFSVSANGLIDEARAFVHGLAAGRAVPAAIAVGGGSLVLILALGRLLPRVPGVFVAVVASIAASVAFDLGTHGVKLVGTLPQGFPPFTVPGPHVSDLPLLAAGAASIALVALTDTISTASAFAARTGEEVNGNGEMIGIGTANVAAGFFQGFPVSTSASRTAVAEQAGAKTQLTGVVAAALIVLMLVLVPGLLRDLPQPTLAAVVIAASLSLANIPATVRLWRQRRSDFVVSITALLGVALLGVLPGIGIAVAFSIFDVFRHVWWPYHTTLGRVPGMRGYHDRQQHPDAAGPSRPRDLPVRRAIAVRQRPDVPRAPAPLRGGRSATHLDRHRRRADHRHRHDRRRHAARARRRTQRQGHLDRLRRAQGPRPGEARALRADRTAQAKPLLPHRPCRRRRLRATRFTRRLGHDGCARRLTARVSTVCLAACEAGRG